MNNQRTLPPLNLPENDDSDDDFEFEEVDENFDAVGSEFEEKLDFQSTLKSVKEVENFEALKQEEEEKKKLSSLKPRPKVIQQPEVIDDFIRNFLEINNFQKSLEMFQNEWYEKETKGDITQIDVVPNLYLQNVKLEQTVKELKEEMKKVKTKAAKIKSTFDQLRKERDYHRMHHHRVVQEKKVLIQDLKVMKKHCDKYEPVIDELKKKYEGTLKKRHLLQMRVESLSSQLKTMQLQYVDHAGGAVPLGKRGSMKRIASSTVPTKRKRKRQLKKPKPGYTFPTEHPQNPFSVKKKRKPTNMGEFNLATSLEGHTMTVSSLALNPTRPWVVSGSDDTTWKMWSVPANKLLMTGEGHKDWVSGCDFHPLGSHVVTCSGDKTVRIWKLSEKKKGGNNSNCCMVLTSHTQAVWDCGFHYTGHFVGSASLDHTLKLFDVKTGVCKVTLRGHKDSVNGLKFVPFSNMIGTCSGDRTVNLWDPVSLKSIETLYGHENAVNDLCFSLSGRVCASADADGVVLIWDMRNTSEYVERVQASHYPANGVDIDVSEQLLVVATEESSLKVFRLDSLREIAGDGKKKRKNEDDEEEEEDEEDRKAFSLDGHKDSVLKVLFSKDGKTITSGGADSSVKVWSS